MLWVGIFWCSPSASAGGLGWLPLFSCVVAFQVTTWVSYRDHELCEHCPINLLPVPQGVKSGCSSPCGRSIRAFRCVEEEECGGWERLAHRFLGGSRDFTLWVRGGAGRGGHPVPRHGVTAPHFPRVRGRGLRVLSEDLALVLVHSPYPTPGLAWDRLAVGGEGL